MIDSMPPAEVANDERFERFGFDANAAAVARVRQDFSEWLKKVFAIDEVRCSDVVLAINEALANSAEFAYLLADQPGTIDIQVIYDADAHTLSACISDRGTWRQRQVEPAPRTRGRGIPLMETLSDDAAIEPSQSGTTVRLEWRGINRR